MGAYFYSYIVNYKPQPDVLFPELRQPDFCVRTALADLRCWVFLSGTYQPIKPVPGDLSEPLSLIPGSELSAIREALATFTVAVRDTNDGSRSILDLDHVAEARKFGVVAPLRGKVLLRLFGTTQPTREMVEMNDGFFEYADRGKGIYIVLYKNGEPDEVLFAGYSFD